MLLLSGKGAVKDGVTKMVCDRWCVRKLYVKDGVAEMVCDRWCVTKLYVKDGVTGGVTKMVCESEAEAKAEEAAGTDLKTRTPRNFVRNIQKIMPWPSIATFQHDVRIWSQKDRYQSHNFQHVGRAKAQRPARAPSRI